MPNLPINPDHRRIVICKEHFAKLAKESILIPSKFDTGVVFLSRDQILSNSLDAYFDESKVRDGSIFLQSPFYKSRYQSLDVARIAFANEKADLALILCKRIGAIGFEYQIEWTNLEEQRRGASVAGSTGSVTVDASLKQDSSVREGEKFLKKVDSIGITPDFLAAEELLKQNHLRSDTILCGLLQSAKEENRSTSETVEIDLIQETRERLEFAAAIKFTGGLSSIKAALTNENSRKVHAKLKMVVRFPPPTKARHRKPPKS